MPNYLFFYSNFTDISGTEWVQNMLPVSFEILKIDCL